MGDGKLDDKDNKPPNSDEKNLDDVGKTLDAVKEIPKIVEQNSKAISELTKIVTGFVKKDAEPPKPPEKDDKEKPKDKDKKPEPPKDEGKSKDDKPDPAKEDGLGGQAKTPDPPAEDKKVEFTEANFEGLLNKAVDAKLKTAGVRLPGVRPPLGGAKTHEDHFNLVKSKILDEGLSLEEFTLRKDELRRGT